MLPIPHRGQKVRWSVILYGLLVFFWLGPEDNHVWPVTLLGTGGAVLMVALWVMGRLGGQTISPRYVPVFGLACGAVIGLGTSLVTTGLMFFKNARHAHLFPDYPPGMMGAVLERAPIWALAGALAGFGLGLVWLAFPHH